MKKCICGHSRSKHFDAMKEKVDEFDYCLMVGCNCLIFKTKKTRKQLRKLEEFIWRNW